MRGMTARARGGRRGGHLGCSHGADPHPHPQADDFPRWYQDVVAKAELAENGAFRGSMIIRPWGYALWEHIQAEMDRRIKATGHSNVMFPSLIPYSTSSARPSTSRASAPSSRS